MTRRLYFRFSQEDEFAEAAAFRVEDGIVISVASAGAQPFRCSPWALQVFAVDVNGPQLHLCRLKAAAVESWSAEPQRPSSVHG